jgi:hypothetical protein
MRRAPVWSLIVILVAALNLSALPASAVQTAQPVVVSENPSDFTPHVLDGKVNAVLQVGDQIVLGGRFTQVQAASGGPVLSRRNMVSFNAKTGAVSAFAPNPDGDVEALVASGDGATIFAGGSFNTMNGITSPSLAKISVSTGASVSGFKAPALNGRIKDLRVAGGRLWLAGGFSKVAGNVQPALATVNPFTGAFDPYMRLLIAGVHRPEKTNQVTGVYKLDIDPSGSRLAAIGNFATVNGVTNDQMLMLDLSGTAAAPADWQTTFYGTKCMSVFDSYMRDLDISPDGQYVVVSTTGAYGGPDAACDTTARFELSSTGADVRPTWINTTGGDTTYAVAVTGSAVYVGGHQRWQNNPFAADAAGPGAVRRPGIAALDPANGLPLSWNPTRTRGVGVFDMLATADGLWLGSDTDRIGNEYHARIAFLPLAGGKAVPVASATSLPADVHLAGGVGSADPAVLYRINAAGSALLSADGTPWAADDNSSLRSGSNTAGWQPGATLSPVVPAGTPVALFDTERWGAMSWDLPVQTGLPIKVRLYFANRYGGTAAAGARVFDVVLEGNTVLDDYDIAADVGHAVGTMKEFSLASDGNIDLDLRQVVENPLINAIEVLRTDVGSQTAVDKNSLAKRRYDGTAAGPSASVPSGERAWGDARGAFMLDGTLYTAWSDGSFTRQSFNGTNYGASIPVNTSDLITVLQAWRSDIQQMTGLFFSNGRVYYTLSGSSKLFYRYFTPESDVVGAKRFEASDSVPGLDLRQVKGMFLAAGKLYWTTPDGSLRRIDWSGTGPVAGDRRHRAGDGGHVVGRPRSVPLPGHGWSLGKPAADRGSGGRLHRPGLRLRRLRVQRPGRQCRVVRLELR